ncbi:hypothetical protein EGW08_010403, partial [Elysia chlorotica]
MNISGPLSFDDGPGLDAAGMTLASNSSELTGRPSRGLTTQVIVIVVIMFILSIVGIVGNAFAFLIYYRKRDKGTSTIFILSLAVTDFLTCLVMIPFTIAIELLLYKLTFQFFCRLFMFLQTYLILLSSFIMVAIGVDRYFCICHPFLRVVTVPRAKIILVVLVLVSLAFCILPTFLYSVYQQEEYNQTVIVYNSTVTFLSPRQNGDAEVGLADVFPSPSAFAGLNDTASQNASYTLVKTLTRELYTGYCYTTFAILPKEIMELYQKFHACIFLAEFIILALLYILIYRSILVRRAWKAKRRRMSGYASTVNGGAEETQLTHINAHGNAVAANGADGGDGTAGVNGSDGQASAETGLLNQKTKDPAAGRVSAAMRDRAFYANIRTAAMLFVVTVAFVVSFLPSWFMGLRILKLNLVVFYMFYINNVINPFIYAFMNRAFRDDLVQLLKVCL